METRKIYRCFISSPGDCQRERESCEKVIDQINNGLAKHLGLSFETFMWEYDVLPDVGKSGQEIIDEYVQKSNYDIFVGIMKNRFGHPTKKAGSGTEHEFNDALNRKKKTTPKTYPKSYSFSGKKALTPTILITINIRKSRILKVTSATKAFTRIFKVLKILKKPSKKS